MRRFELTISVWVDDEYPLPFSFNEWIEAAGLQMDGATPTQLMRVVETRHPPAEDIVERRGDQAAVWS